MARRDANTSRLTGYGDDEFARGVYVGQVIVADCYLDADRLLVMAAKNEMHFLCFYSERTQ
jgi:hypothetical protein